VVVRDRTNIRHVAVDDIGGPVDLVVADLSFISLTLVMRDLAGLLGQDADLVVLVKPQFEAARAEVDRGRGVIGDPEVWRRVLTEVIAAFAERGATIMGAMASPLTGSDGNVEFLLHVRASDAVGGSTASVPGADPAALVSAAVADARARRA
jgi:23S rRNA (cytidine1920-2'-O)/16S rRNA (cytidine1409-2'-O)-methyltransferase